MGQYGMAILQSELEVIRILRLPNSSLDKVPSVSTGNVLLITVSKSAFK